MGKLLRMTPSSHGSCLLTNAPVDALCCGVVHGFSFSAENSLLVHSEKILKVEKAWGKEMSAREPFSCLSIRGSLRQERGREAAPGWLRNAESALSGRVAAPPAGADSPEREAHLGTKPPISPEGRMGSQDSSSFPWNPGNRSVVLLVDWLLRTDVSCLWTDGTSSVLLFIFQRGLSWFFFSFLF